MQETIPPFYGSNNNAVRKLNLMRERVNNTRVVCGDNFNLTNISQGGTVSNLSIDQLIARVRGLGGGGVSNIHSAFVAEDAPASDHIICILDSDSTDPGVWALQEWNTGDVITGTDSNTYNCIATYTPADMTTKPITGEDYATKWVLVTEIDVYCNISGGGNLEDALPHLLTMHKTVGYDGTIPDEWTAVAHTEGDYVIGTNSKEYYQCILADAGSVDTRPSSGDDWETYWEVAKRFADELMVVKVGDTWKALGLFEASFESSPMAP